MKIKSLKALGLAIFASAALIPGMVYASTAANTTITNTVTVNFANAANVAQTAVTSSVSFTVNLISAAPTLVAGADIDPSTEATSETLYYTITSNANGPDEYNVGSVTTNTDINSPTGYTIPSSVTLGATTIAAYIEGDGTSAVITVPYDGTDDSSANGIVAGDILMINSTEYTVASVDESTGATTNVVTITLSANVSGGPVVAGTIVPERQVFAASLTTGTTITSPKAFGTHEVEVKAYPVTASDLTATDSATITVRKPLLAVTKYVRNATSGTTFNASGTGTMSIGGVDYFTGGITGKPGDTMEYVIVVDNTATGAGVAKNIIVSDPIPMFTTLATTSVYLIDATTTALGSVTFPGTALNVAVDGDAAKVDSDTLYVYAGTGGDDSGTGGSLNLTEYSLVRFQVTID